MHPEQKVILKFVNIIAESLGSATVHFAANILINDEFDKWR